MQCNIIPYHYAGIRGHKPVVPHAGPNSGKMKEVKLAGVRAEDAADRTTWRKMIHCGEPCREKPKRKKKTILYYTIPQK